MSLLPTPANISPAVFRAVLAGATAAYSINKGVPTIEQIRVYCNCTVPSISKTLASPEFKSVMRMRGYPMDHVTLSPEQIFAVGVITNPTNRKPLSAKLKMCGIPYATYRAWLKQPHFQQYLTKISEDMLGEHIADVHTRLTERAMGGEIQAIKLFYELNGRHDPQRQQMVDLNNIIGLLLEVITRYVPDSIALSHITKDIDVILSGGVPKALETFDVSRIAKDIVDAVVVPDEEPVFDFEFKEVK